MGLDHILYDQLQFFGFESQSDRVGLDLLSFLNQNATKDFVFKKSPLILLYSVVTG